MTGGTLICADTLLSLKVDHIFSFLEARGHPGRARGTQGKARGPQEALGTPMGATFEERRVYVMGSVLEWPLRAAITLATHSHPPDIELRCADTPHAQRHEAATSKRLACAPHPLTERLSTS